MAKTMGITAKPFSHSIEGKIMELQRDFMVYVCNLSDTAQPGTQATQTTFKPRHDLQVTIDASGYPVMPMEPTEDVVQTKSELAGLLRTYLNKHYCMWRPGIFSICTDINCCRSCICPATKKCSFHTHCGTVQ